ncbi:hypothetical protein [Actinoplanes nipponensis]|uniref:hypothetical protein n=1 Tax=Actinoplanes nipponensis TaxID=135950 RepID=UPI0031E5A3FC
MATAPIAMSALRAVTGTSYRIGRPTTLKPSIATKCMVQMPVPPMATAARVSHQARQPALGAVRSRTAHTSPSSDPSTDSV